MGTQHLVLPGEQARDGRTGTDSCGCSLDEEKKKGFHLFPVYKRREEDFGKGHGHHRNPLDGAEDLGLFRRSFDDAPQATTTMETPIQISIQHPSYPPWPVCYSGNLYFGAARDGCYSLAVFYSIH